MCRDVNTAALSWCIHHLQQFTLKPPKVIDSYGMRGTPPTHLHQGKVNREQISQFLTVRRFSLNLLGHRKCVARCTWTKSKNKSLSGTAGATGSVKSADENVLWV